MTLPVPIKGKPDLKKIKEIGEQFKLLEFKRLISLLEDKERIEREIKDIIRENK